MLDIPFISLPVLPPILRNRIHPVHRSKCAIFYIFRPRCCQQFYRNKKRPVHPSKCSIFYLSTGAHHISPGPRRQINTGAHHIFRPPPLLAQHRGHPLYPPAPPYGWLSSQSTPSISVHKHLPFTECKLTDSPNSVAPYAMAHCTLSVIHMVWC
jgi:hypothetical protein